MNCTRQSNGSGGKYIQLSLLHVYIERERVYGNVLIQLN